MERQGVMELGVLRLCGEGVSQEFRRQWGSKEDADVEFVHEQ